MSKFFVDASDVQGGSIFIRSKEDVRHIVKVLRLKEGAEIEISDSAQWEYTARICFIGEDEVEAEILDKQKFAREPELQVTLFQGIPKQSKMETIIQKCVELGVYEVVPVFMERTVVVDRGKFYKKQERWQKIAEEAAKQSGRGVIPEVAAMADFKAAVKQAAQQGEILLFYEGGGEGIARLVGPETKTISVFIGPEGGFEASEVAFAQQFSAKAATLGPRILRTETAPIAALAAIMLASGNME